MHCASLLNIVADFPRPLYQDIVPFPPCQIIHIYNPKHFTALLCKQPPHFLQDFFFSRNMAQKPVLTPNLEFPSSERVVNVSVINSTARIRCPLGFFVQDPLPGHETLNCPAFVFLIEGPQGKKVLFDLGVRTDKESLPPVIRSGLAGLQMDAEKDVAKILQAHGISPAEIDSIIWRSELSQHAFCIA